MPVILREQLKLFEHRETAAGANCSTVGQNELAHMHLTTKEARKITFNESR